MILSTEYLTFFLQKCPFIYKHETGPWATMGELVNYNPDMAQWEGDGELVGVRSRIIFTHSDNVLHAPEYISPYFTSVGLIVNRVLILMCIIDILENIKSR